MLIFEANFAHCLLQTNYHRQYILMSNMLSNDLIHQSFLQAYVPLSAFIGWVIWETLLKEDILSDVHK